MTEKKKKDGEEKEISDREEIWNAIGGIEGRLEDIEKILIKLKSGTPQLGW